MEKNNSHVYTLEDGSTRKVTLVKVTKEMAERLLEQNTCNRTKKNKNLARIEQDLRDGKFISALQPICIYENGKIADGQHRLSMIAKTGISAELFIIENFPVEAKNVIDTGVSRSTADVLAINGHQYSQTLSTAANIVMSLRAADERGKAREFSSRHYTAFVPRVVEEEVSNNPLYSEYVPFAFNTIGSNTTIMSRGQLLALMVYLIGEKGHDKEVVKDFLLQLADLKPACGTIRTFRRMMGDKDKRTQLSEEAKSTYIKRTWNAFAEGRFDITKLYFNKERDSGLNFI